MYAYIVIVLLACAGGLGSFIAGKYVGKSECIAESLRQTIKQAAEDSDARTDWEDDSVKAAVANAKTEADNDTIARAIQQGVERDGSGDPCVRARFLRQLESLK